MLKAVLKAGKEKKIRNYYPNVFADELAEAPPTAGVAELYDAEGQYAATGYFDPKSRVALRVYRWERGELDRGLFRERLEVAQAKREHLGPFHRLVHAEADGLPGLVVDRFGETLVVQVRNRAMEALRDFWLPALLEVARPAGVYERSDADARRQEGLPNKVGVIHGSVPEVLEVEEDGLVFPIPLALAQKTGFYLDQRDNRRLLESRVKPGERVLDVYSYVGGFALRAARAGAYALAVDKDLGALAVLDRAARRHRLAVDIRSGDALEVLKDLAKKARPFHHILLDPPTLVKKPDELPRVKRLLVELLNHALELLAPRGYLWLSSCAYYLTLEDLLEVARRAAADQRRRLRVESVTYQPSDHPWSLQVPESLYLKTLVVQDDPLSPAER